MGKRNAIRRNAIAAAMIDSDDDAYSISSKTLVSSDQVSVGYGTDVDKDTLLDQCLDDLYEKRGSTREKALERIIDVLSSSLQHEFVEKNSSTLLNQCLNFIRAGLSKEISLASHAVGLLASTTSSVTNAREIVEESLPTIAKSLSSSSESPKVVSLLECLAVITFVGWENPEITEQAMQIMWQVIFPKWGSNEVADKPTMAVIIAMISAWSILLTTVNGWSLSLQDWQEFISYLSTLLDMDDRAVRTAAGEALAVIHEVGDFERFSNEGRSSNGYGRYMLLEELTYKVLNQARALASEAGGKGTSKKDLNNQRNLFRDLVDYLEHGYSPETSVKIGGGSITMSSWTQLIRLNFLRRFLRGGFVKHMMENGFLHDVFEFTPKKIYLDIENHSAKNKSNEKKLCKSRNAASAKKQTQDLNKERKNIKDKIGHFAVACGDW